MERCSPATYSQCFKAFILSSILTGVLIILLLYSNIVLNVYHPIALARPLDTAFIHAPIRLFLNLPLTLLFPVSILYVHNSCFPLANNSSGARTFSIAIGHSWEQGNSRDYNNHAWEGFGILFVLNLLYAIYVAMRRDIVWTVSSSWLALSVWRETPKSAPVSVSNH